MSLPIKPAGGRTLSVSLIVSCFNYGRFLSAAIKSACKQTEPFDEIILIDDASTDETSEVTAALCAQVSGAIKVIRHASNRGQLAAFQSGLAIAKGSIVCFLDADDVFHRDYVAQVLACYRANPACTFTFCRERQFREQQELEDFLATVPSTRGCVDHGLTVLRTVHYRHWIGNITSCISIRRDLADRILPLSLEEDWVTGADDCLVWGASLAAGRKFELKNALVGYRLHGRNASVVSKKQRADYCVVYLRGLSIDRLFHALQAKLGCGRGCAWHAQLEFFTVAVPSRSRLKLYVGIAFRAGGFSISTARAVLHMVSHFFRSRRLRE